MAVGPNGEAARRSVLVLGDDDRYAGLAQAVVSLADDIDEGRGNAGVWAQYLNGLRDVLEVVDVGDDELQRVLDGFAEMGD